MPEIKGFGDPDFRLTPRGYLPIEYNAEVVKANLLNLLHTAKGERVMMPNYGSDLPNLLFRPNTESLHRDIEQAIIEAIDRWEPRIVVNNLDVGIPTNEDLIEEADNESVVYIKLSYSPKFDLSADEIVEFILRTS